MKHKSLKNGMAMVVRPQNTTIVSFLASPKKANWKPKTTGMLIDKNSVKIPRVIMRYKNGEGTLMLPNAYLNKTA